MLNRNSSEIVTGVELFTPEAANAALEKMTMNRKAQPKKINEYASAMERGQWTLSQPIIFDKRGYLIDGQHRLRAVIRAGVPQSFVTIRGLATDSMFHVDIGKPRTVIDILSLYGIKNTSQVAAIVRAVVGVENGAKNVTLIGNMFTPPTVDDLVNRALNDELIQDIARTIPRAFSKMLKSTQYAGWFIYCARRGLDDNLPLFEDFIEIVIGKKSAQSAGDPTLVLANRLNRVEHAVNRTDSKTRIALTVKAWNAFYNGSTITHLAYKPVGSRPESFPLMALDKPISAAGYLSEDDQ